MICASVYLISNQQPHLDCQTAKRYFDDLRLYYKLVSNRSMLSSKYFRTRQFLCVIVADATPHKVVATCTQVPISAKLQRTHYLCTTYTEVHLYYDR